MIEVSGNNCVTRSPILCDLHIILFFPIDTAAPIGHGLLFIEAARSHSDTPHSVEILCMSDRLLQRSLRDNTPHSQETDIYPPDGIRTRNPSQQEAADPRLRWRGSWNRPL